MRPKSGGADKTPLIKASEELNYRLWNLSENIGNGWHNIDKSEWLNGERYYLKSTVYRLLIFFYHTLKAEASIYNFDLSLADSEDKKYLKYIKTLKHFFCEAIILKELQYDSSECTHHFYKDDLAKFVSFVEKDNQVISYPAFEERFKTDNADIELVIRYVANMKDDDDNLNYNVVKAFHLFLLLFLNEYGLDYHHTSKEKMILLSTKYSNLKIKKGYYEFLLRNKVLKEAKFIVQKMALKSYSIER